MVLKSWLFIFIFEEALKDLIRPSVGCSLGGGYNDRQEVERHSAESEPDPDGYDDFGRRVVGKKVPATKQERAKAALERLKQKASQGSKGSDSRHRDRSRSPCEQDRREHKTS